MANSSASGQETLGQCPACFTSSFRKRNTPPAFCDPSGNVGTSVRAPMTSRQPTFGVTLAVNMGWLTTKRQLALFGRWPDRAPKRTLNSSKRLIGRTRARGTDGPFDPVDCVTKNLNPGPRRCRTRPAPWNENLQFINDLCGRFSPAPTSRNHWAASLIWAPALSPRRE